MRKLIIHTNEVEQILGCKQRTAQAMLRTIKDVYNKKKHQAVTIREFCEYEGLPYQDVFNEINKITPKQDIA